MQIGTGPLSVHLRIPKLGPTWYQISDADRMILPDVQRTFAQQMNATTPNLNAIASK